MKLSKFEINSFCCNVVPVELISDKDITKADITWSVEDTNVATVRSFNSDSPYSYRSQALVTLHNPGKTTLFAKIGNEKFECEIRVREMKKADLSVRPEYFRGDFHDHTSEDHKYDSFANRQTDFPIDYINVLKKENKFDFAVITDHADVTNDRDFFRGFTDTELAMPMKTVMFPGAESEISSIEEDRYGLTHKNSGEIVTVNANNFAGVKTWQEFYDAFADSPYAVMVLAHPHVVGWDKNGIWNFSLHKNNTPYFKQVLRGVEMGNGSTRSSNAIHEMYYSVALDNGFKVSVTCSSDCHSEWGFDSLPGKTIIMAPDGSKEMLLDALLNRRFYASESGNVKLYYTVNGNVAAQTLELTDKYSFHIECDYFEDDKTTVPVRCQVISDGGVLIKEFENVDFSSFDFEIQSDTASYFYLRFIDSEGRKTWSAPVWTSRQPKGTANPENLIAIDKKDFKATDLDTGKDASLVINDDPEQYWESDGETASLLIDMGKEYEICAVGQYPARILLKKLMAAEIPINSVINKFAVDYRISVSSDGQNFTECKKGMFRIFGGEEYITFDPVKTRYIKFESFTTAGKYSCRKEFANSNIIIGELTPFTK